MRILSIALILGFALSCFFLAGCSESYGTRDRSAEVDRELMTETEARKLELLAAIDRKYENPRAHYELAKIYHEDGMWDKAKWEYDRTLAFDPVHPGAQAGLVKVLQDRGENQHALILSEQYISHADSSATRSYKLGKAFEDYEMDDYALQCYQQALRLAPNSVEINKAIGYYYLSRGDRNRAQDYLRRVMQLDPYQADVAGELGRMGVRVTIPRTKKVSGKKIDRMAEEQ